MKMDKVQFYRQTLRKILRATELQAPGEHFWLAEKEGEVAGYVLAHIGEVGDGGTAYWVEQGFVNKGFRDGFNLKTGWKDLEAYARSIFCSCILNVTNRKPKVYLRLLGKDWSEYTHILKKDLGG